MMRCPNCQQPVAFRKEIFKSVRCGTCNTMLLVSQTYLRMLGLLSFLIAWALLWVLNVRSMFYPFLGVLFGFLASLWLGFPVAFLVLTVLVQTVPRVVSPKLVLRHWGAITTLDLRTQEDDATTPDVNRRI